MAYMRLGDLLVASGTITGQQLERALTLQKETKQRLGDVLIQNGFITEAQLIDALRVQLGVDFVDLTAISIPVELAQYVPRNIAKKYYGDGSQYTKIYEANKGTIGSNPNLIKPGQKLVIP